MYSSPQSAPFLPETGPAQLRTEFSIQLTPFDQKHYRELIEARAKAIQGVLKKLVPALRLATALDAGCGVGFFSQTLVDGGLHVRGFDARFENVQEARRRFPEMSFMEGDIEQKRILDLGISDLVLCFGLLYHLENPMLAIRHLRRLTGKCLLVESMCVPGEKPAMLLRDEPRQDDQSLTDVAFYPSEASLVKMLYRGGFPAVYRVLDQPDHADFHEGPDQARRRTLLLAAHAPLDVAGFRLMLEPHETENPWVKSRVKTATLPQRLGRFFVSPARRKYITFANRARRIFPRMPIPLRLPFGAWWFAEKSALDDQLLYNQFEPMETQFVSRLLQRDMTVVDAGAHHGFYTILASKRVGWHGRVIAIEPSPRECRRLETHLRLNRCSNTIVESCALGDEPGETDLYLVDAYQDWCNSLRPPDVDGPVHAIRVQVRRLDDILSEHEIKNVDFLKLDVEGAELPVLHGSLRLLNGKKRPAILSEVQEVRTKQWGYAAREILQFLIRMDYRWFAIAAKGALLPISCDQESYDANLVALPVEREEEILASLGHKS